MVSIFPDGRFKAFRVSNTPLEKWTPNHHKSQNVTLMAAVLGNSESQAISDVEIAREDPEAEKMSASQPAGKNWSNPRSPNGASQLHPAKFTGWFGNAKKFRCLQPTRITRRNPPLS